MNPLVDDAGRPFPLGPELARGGEGAVHLVPSDPTSLAKVYLRPLAPPAVEKLTALVACARSGQLPAVAAWPNRLLFDGGTRRVAGYVMPRLTDYQPFQRLYNPVMRLRHFPRAGWRSQVRAARTLAAAFAALHAAGFLMGDVNEGNEMVSGAGEVRLIDCDSFQFRANGRTFPCEVGTPHYTPPELQGWSLRGLVRTENHDRFGLAVLVYQLLFVGRHPYAGVYRGPGDPSFEEFIAEYRFAQGPLAHTWDMAPPPNAPTFDDIPPDLGTLFRRAFERGSDRGTRPTAAEWASALERLEQSVVTCRADAGHEHWNGQRQCVWCRLARNGGPEYYFGVAGGGAAFAVDEAALQRVLRRLAAVPFAEFPPPPTIPATSPAPRPLPAVLTALLEAWRLARANAERKLAPRLEVERAELQAIEEAVRRRIAARRRAFRDECEELDTDIETAREAVQQDKRSRAALTGALVVGVGLGLLLLPFGFVARTAGLIGGIVAAVFGVWLAVHLLTGHRSAARRELSAARARRRLANDELDEALDEIAVRRAEARLRVTRASAAIREGLSRSVVEAARECRGRLLHLEGERRLAGDLAREREAAMRRNWTAIADRYRVGHSEAVEHVRRLTAECRALAGEYAGEYRQLTANAESLSRVRHLRLHSLADEEETIPLIGIGRRGSLAANGITTAADVARDRIMLIRGFKGGLAGNLLAWREDVLRRFRFDPATDVSPTETSALADRFRSRQRELLAEVETRLEPHEASAERCRAALEGLVPELRLAATEREQADADVLLLSHHLSSDS